MKTRIEVTDLEALQSIVEDGVSFVAGKKGVRYADVRVGMSEGVVASCEDEVPKLASKDWGFSLGVRVIAGRSVLAAGYYGRELGVRDFLRFERVLAESLKSARERAFSSAVSKSRFRKQAGKFGACVTSTELAPIPTVRDSVLAEYTVDPRSVTPTFLTEYARRSCAAAKSAHPFVRKVEVGVSTIMERQLFASSEGSVIDQSWCTSGGTVFVVAANDRGGTPADLYHHTGNQLGVEALTKGENAHQKTFEAFARQIGEEAAKLADAEPMRREERPVVVVLDPDLVALFAHEIIGHPSELDRALKMESGYAGRSWFFTDLSHTVVGERIASPLVTAFSDPTMKGAYGYYRYDDEGTRAKRVYHLRQGIYEEFMNSRQTALVTGKMPNGHYKANDASVVPLIRMSVSAIAGGKDDPAAIISDVEHGYYCVGHRIPSISESRENFQIAPRLIYEIRSGKIGKVFRDGRVTADSRDFFMSIDAVGNDFTVFPIPNCGKGQPMQTKQVGNGGPTIRARAKIARGAYSRT